MSGGVDGNQFNTTRLTLLLDTGSIIECNLKIEKCASKPTNFVKLNLIIKLQSSYTLAITINSNLTLNKPPPSVEFFDMNTHRWINLPGLSRLQLFPTLMMILYNTVLYNRRERKLQCKVTVNKWKKTMTKLQLECLTLKSKGTEGAHDDHS